MFYTSTSTFTQDLKSSQQGEIQLANQFEQNGWNVSTTIDKGKFSGYDLEIERNGFQFTIEFKHDLKCEDTGNVAIELFKTVNNNIQVSGLSATTADYYVYKLGRSDDLYAIKTEILRDYLRDNERRLRHVTGGDGGRVHLVLVPVADFKSINKVLFN
jgi:hypothetical protein